MKLRDIDVEAGEPPAVPVKSLSGQAKIRVKMLARRLMSSLCDGPGCPPPEA